MLRRFERDVLEIPLTDRARTKIRFRINYHRLRICAWQIPSFSLQKVLAIKGAWSHLTIDEYWVPPMRDRSITSCQVHGIRRPFQRMISIGVLTGWLTRGAILQRDATNEAQTTRKVEVSYGPKLRQNCPWAGITLRGQCSSLIYESICRGCSKHSMGT